MRVRIMGVDYLRVEPTGGGDLYVTAHGLPLRDRLASLCWFDPTHRAERWRRLTGTTGSVHRVSLRPSEEMIPGADPGFDPVVDPSINVGPLPGAGAGDRRGSERSLSCVVKFCRFGQEVAIGARSSFLAEVPAEVIASARFIGPFEEFARILGMRRAARERGLHRLRTKRPLAIYCPAQRYSSWELGRNSGELRRCRTAMRAGPGDDDVPLHEDRDYLLIYSWLRGVDAQSLHDGGVVGEDFLRRITRQTTGDMRRCGYRSLDHKPSHVILRPRHDARGNSSLLPGRDGIPAYALVDFELQVPEQPGPIPPDPAPEG